MPRTRRRGGSDGPPTGCPLGLFDTAPYEPGETAIAADDLRVFYSDGVTEATNDVGEEYGDARLRAWALLHESSRARTMALLHEYPLRVGRRGSHFSGPRMVQQIDRD